MNACFRRWIGVGLYTGIAFWLGFQMRSPQKPRPETTHQRPVSSVRSKRPKPAIEDSVDFQQELSDFVRLAAEIWSQHQCQHQPSEGEDNTRS